MSDTPIYDNLTTDPLRNGRQVVRAGHSTARVPIDPAAARAIQGWLGRNTQDLAAVLAPFGLHPHDIAEPRYERVVYLDEVPKFVNFGFDGSAC